MDFKKLYKSELRRLFLHFEEECLYYNKENNTCQSKKCATGGDGTVTLLDRIFCEPYKKETEDMPYIEKNELLNGIYSDNPEDVMLYIARFPTSDVVERKAGKWVEPTREGCITYDKHAYAECSACGEKAYLGWWMHYCPNCGAEMKGEKNDRILR